ncbi:MAG: hypothetical protein KDH17_15655 [Rhodocyclaceae bacterium]|nr:hypothetical protein [Rhodocyclaceae bacterium]
MNDASPRRDALRRQLGHWQRALAALLRFDEIAAPDAWASLEPALVRTIRDSFSHAASRQMAELASLERRATGADGGDDAAIEARLVALRQRYSLLETTVDFYGDAINSRSNPVMQRTLAGLDRLAGLSMQRLLAPLGHPVPPVLCYVDRGLGAAILKAGLRLWDPTVLSPAATIKIARHNLMRPTALIHETGHQVAHILGWNEALADALEDALSGESSELARVWAGWSSEIAADSYAFVQTGYAAVANLHDVLAGGADYVLRYVAGDPHPVSYVRVLLGVEMCNAVFGDGPWQGLARALIMRYPLVGADPEVAALARASLPMLPRLARLCLDVPLPALGARGLSHWIDPGEVAPPVLQRLALAGGGALSRSPYWSAAEPLRILALSGLQMVTQPARATAIAETQQQWLQRLETLPAAA